MEQEFARLTLANTELLQAIAESVDRQGRAQSRIEEKLDLLLSALAEDEEEQPRLTLDGEPAGEGRDQTQAL
jgi:low affinity Fe/Cu permease